MTETKHAVEAAWERYIAHPLSLPSDEVGFRDGYNAAKSETCEWTEGRPGGMHAGCGPTFIIEPTYKFCPNCGEKIEVK